MESTDRLTRWQQQYKKHIKSARLVQVTGKVKRVTGTLVEASLPFARLNDLCAIESGDQESILAEIIGFTEQSVLLSALGALDGIASGSKITPYYMPHQINVSNELLGGVYDGFGRALSPDKPDAFCITPDEQTTPVIRDAIAPTQRPRISQMMPTGLRVLDALLTIGEGQRIGVFAGAGCGKTTLLAELARNMPCDVIVFGLIGERGRELREFLDHELDDELREKSVLVCATSDRSSMERTRAASTATAVAEGFREQGLSVLLLIDSLTRFARAQREIGLAAGEPAGRGGFPPSTYTMLPRLVERSGNKEGAGSITALYTVLMEGDSIQSDPVADEVRSLLDGHIVLSRKLAEQNHYPAVDVLGSISRTMINVVPPEQMELAGSIRQLLAAYKDSEMLIRLGEYEQGNDLVTDLAIELRDDMNLFLQQKMREPYPIENTLQALAQLTQPL